MNALAALVDELGGFATTRQLKAHGATERMLTSAVRVGAVRRARNGHYSTRSARDPEFRAVRVGGRLTGLSALELLGCWVWTRPARLQVSVPRAASRIKRRRTPAVDVHWESGAAERGGTRTAVSLENALLRVVLDEPLETAVACLDWALHTGRLDRVGLEQLVLQLPASARSIRRWVDIDSQSVLESVQRVRVMRRGWRVRSQARLGEIEAIDLLVEDQVALELDGREFHGDRFEADRLRDLRVTIEGRHAIRVSSRMMRENPALVEQAVAAALAARRRGDAGNSGTRPAHPRGTRRPPRRGTWNAGVSLGRPPP